MTPLNNAVMGTDSAAVDLKMPAPGDQGYDEWRKTGKLPELAEAEPVEHAEEKPETQVQEHETRSSEEEESAPSASVTAAASEAARPQKGKKTADARKAELNAEIRELTRKAADLRQSLTQPSVTPESRPAAEPEKKTEPARGKAEPQLDDKNTDGTPKYKIYAEYQKDWSNWVMKEAVREARAAASEHTTTAQKQQETARAQAIIAEVWNGRVTEARTKHADFDAVALNPELPIKQGSITDAFILDSDHGAEVLYYLGKNPAELTRIQVLNPLAQARALFSIENTFSVAPAAKPAASAKPVTKAPPPPHQVSGKPAAQLDEVEQAVKEGDQEAFARLENEKLLDKMRQGRRRA
jgi:hypothetical protein